MIVLQRPAHRVRTKGIGATKRASLTLSDLTAVMRPGVRYSPASLARITGAAVADVIPFFEARGLRALSGPKKRPEPPRLEAMAIPEVAEIVSHVAEQYGVSAIDLLGPSRVADFVEPRHEVFAVVWELNTYSLRELGEMFNKTGNAVAYGLERHFERLRERAELERVCG